MAIALFDTLKFAKRLKEAGVSSAHAEAEAEVLSEIFAVNFQELPTKQDLQAVKEELQHEIKGVREELRVEIKDLRKDISGFRTEVDSKLEKLELRLTIKLTFIMAALLGAAAALSKFFS
ncbi:CCDC90 family protein [Mycoavidus sp. SF9855]|uniref:CCDC90 family protein n=1 Tax=Mycoavidus sp. SF9855 TaxID=2968475 RepID=UPI00211B9DD7|nr:CCDC90 family protein [Mycoavidus sp. SF9855]UUM21652.1 CCDC90 family protein [Mycoavidus sp. SF9855]